MVANRTRRTIVALAFGALIAALAFLPGRVSKSQSYKGHPVGTSLLAHGAVHERGERGRRGGGGVRRPRVSRRRRSRSTRSRARSRRTTRSPKQAPKLSLEVGLPRARHARRRPARHAVVHQADAVVRPRHGADRRPEVQAAGVHALRRRGRRRRLADEERARAEPRRGSRSPTGSRRTRSARSPSTRTTRPARRSTSAPARRTAAATARPASASTRRPTTARTGRSSPARSPPRTTAAITWIAIEPGNANHILIGTRSGARGEGSNATSTGTPPRSRRPSASTTRPTAARRSRSPLAGSINEIKFDPSDPSTVYATLGGSATGGLLRSTAGGAAGSWTADLPGEPRPLLVRAGEAAERQDAHLPRRRERRRPGRAGLPHRRREPAGGDADRELEQRGLDAALEPDRRHARASRSTTTATRRSSARSAATTCSSCRRPSGRTWSSSAASCTTRS